MISTAVEYDGWVFATVAIYSSKAFVSDRLTHPLRPIRRRNKQYKLQWRLQDAVYFLIDCLGPNLNFTQIFPYIFFSSFQSSAIVNQYFSNNSGNFVWNIKIILIHILYILYFIFIVLVFQSRINLRRVSLYLLEFVRYVIFRTLEEL